VEGIHSHFEVDTPARARASSMHYVAVSALTTAFSTHGMPIKAYSASVLTCARPRAALSMVEQIPKPDAGGFPFRLAFLALVTVQSAIGLTSGREIGGILAELSGQRPMANDIDYIGTIVDAGFLAFGASTLINQAGLINENPISSSSPMATLNGMECRVTLSVGREPGTWMPQDWAASGARLSLPLTVRFSEEIVDLGFPSEEALNPSGSRYAKKLYCDGGSFVGASGEVVVKASGGAWATEPSARNPGAQKLNFFIDFPEGAKRNDVTLPAGRVFFSSAIWESKQALPDGITDGVLLLPDGEKAAVVEGPGGLFLLSKGGVTIKRNDFRNLWGSLGDVMLILGKFSVAV
jgi:hypothetical protein